MTLLNGKVDVRFRSNPDQLSRPFGLYGRGSVQSAVRKEKLVGVDEERKPVVDKSVTLLCNSSHHSTSLRFIGASTHRRQSISYENSTDIERFSDSSEDTEELEDDEDSFDCDDGSSNASDESSVGSYQDLEESYRDIKNGYAFSLVKIQSMRFGVSVSEIEASQLDEIAPVVPEVDASIPHPRDTYRKILLEDVGTYSHRSYLVVPDDFFVAGDVGAHTLELLTAVRQGDVETIKQMKAEGRNLQCRNRFNETIVHTAARRGELQVLQYLIQEAGVSPRVCCDMGRTPLHDAAWTGKPNFETVTLLLQDCSDFLALTDSRRCTPFDYIPQSAFQEWNEYLEGHRRLLVPKGYF